MKTIIKVETYEEALKNLFKEDLKIPKNSLYTQIFKMKKEKENADRRSSSKS